MYRKSQSARLFPFATVASVLMTAGLLPALASPNAVEDLPESVTFTEHVAPIFMEHCVACHRPGDVAPMSLMSHREVRPWARSIRRVVSSRDMPPWDANPKYGKFSNDISLSDHEIAMVSRWVEQGAVEGDPELMPAPPQLPEAGSWKMGREPDYVIELDAVDVAAGGPDLFMTQVYGMEVSEGKWLQAVELLPGNTNVLHHVVTYLGPFGMSDDDDSNAGINSVRYLNDASKKRPGMMDAPSIAGVWVAGSPPTVFPQGYGHTLKRNQLISLNMHYHPSGQAGTDASKLGFYFGEGPIEKEITTAFAADPGMWIPAGAEHHVEQARYMFSQDSSIISFLPHMHQRGKSMRYALTLPDGTEQIVLDVPQYDYDWQNIYRLDEPIPAPAGSLLTVDAVWDNSEGNAANPDASLDVPWGDGTNNEMLVAFVDFVVDEGVAPKAVRSRDKVAKLLALHPADHSYAVTIDGMGMGGPFGLVVPPDGEGTLYVNLNSLMFSSSVPGIEHTEYGTLFNGSMITSGGGTRTPIAFLVTEQNADSISGEVFFGRELTTENAKELEGTGRGFSGVSRSASVSAPSP